MKLSEAIEALFQGAKITKSNGSWGKNYIYWDQKEKRLRNNKNESYNAPLSLLMFISQSEGDCWTIVKEKQLIPFGEMPAGELGVFEDASAFFIKTKKIQSCNLIMVRVSRGYISTAYATGFLKDDDLVEYPIDIATR